VRGEEGRDELELLVAGRPARELASDDDDDEAYLARALLFLLVRHSHALSVILQPARSRGHGGGGQAERKLVRSVGGEAGGGEVERREAYGSE